MKALQPFISLLTFVTALTHHLAADTNYFLVGPAPKSPATDSFVIALSKPEDIAHARDLILRGPNPGGVPNAATVGATVRGGADGINRDFLNPTFSDWSWRVTEAVFCDAAIPEIWYTAPAQLEVVFAGSGDTGSVNAVFWNYTVVKVLGAQPLFLSITPHGQNLEIYWSGLGTNYLYTLESAESRISTNWTALPGAAWPLNTNHWTLAETNASGQFFRVKAEPLIQAAAATKLD